MHTTPDTSHPDQHDRKVARALVRDAREAAHELLEQRRREMRRDLEKRTEELARSGGLRSRFA